MGPILFTAVFSGFYLFQSNPIFFHFCYFLVTYSAIGHCILRVYLSDIIRVQKAEKFLGYVFLHQHVSHSALAKKAAVGVIVGAVSVGTPYLMTMGRDKSLETQRNNQVDALGRIATTAQNEGHHDVAHAARHAQVEVQARPNSPTFVPPSSPSVSISDDSVSTSSETSQYE